MLRVIKSTNLNLGYEPEPVAIDNTVVIKQKEIPAEETEGDNVFREFVAEDVTDIVFEPSETPEEIALLEHKEELEVGKWYKKVNKKGEVFIFNHQENYKS